MYTVTVYVLKGLPSSKKGVHFTSQPLGIFGQLTMTSIKKTKFATARTKTYIWKIRYFSFKCHNPVKKVTPD